MQIQWKTRITALSSVASDRAWNWKSFFVEMVRREGYFFCLLLLAWNNYRSCNSSVLLFAILFPILWPTRELFTGEPFEFFLFLLLFLLMETYIQQSEKFTVYACMPLIKICEANILRRTTSLKRITTY